MPEIPRYAVIKAGGSLFGIADRTNDSLEWLTKDELNQHYSTVFEPYGVYGMKMGSSGVELYENYNSWYDCEDNRQEYLKDSQYWNNMWIKALLGKEIELEDEDLVEYIKVMLKSMPSFIKKFNETEGWVADTYTCLRFELLNKYVDTLEFVLAYDGNVTQFYHKRVYPKAKLPYDDVEESKTYYINDENLLSVINLMKDTARLEVRDNIEDCKKLLDVF